MKRMGWKRLLAGILCVSMLGSQVSWAASGTGTAVPESWETVSETVGAEGPGAMQADLRAGDGGSRQTARSANDRVRRPCAM